VTYRLGARMPARASVPKKRSIIESTYGPRRSVWPPSSPKFVKLNAAPPVANVVPDPLCVPPENDDAPVAVSDAFIGARLGPDGGRLYGTLPAGTNTAAILARA